MLKYVIILIPRYKVKLCDNIYRMSTNKTLQCKSTNVVCKTCQDGYYGSKCPWKNQNSIRLIQLHCLLCMRKIYGIKRREVAGIFEIAGNITIVVAT